MPQAFVGIGSNIDPESNVIRALRLIASRVNLIGISTVYKTQPVGRPDQPPYYNCVAEIETDLPPAEVKEAVLRRIEADLGRVRSEDKYSARTIDLDLLLYDDLTMRTEGLTLPDPDIPSRPFLAIPLYELAPDLSLPGSGERIRDVAAAFSDHTMRALTAFTNLLRKEILHERKQ